MGMWGYAGPSVRFVVSVRNGIIAVIVIVIVFNLGVRILAVPITAESLHLHQPPDRHGAYSRQNGKRPPRQDNVPPLDAQRERSPANRRPRRASERRDAGGDAVEGAEDAEADGGVGEEDGGAGEGEDDAKAFEEHDAEHGGLLGYGGGQEGGEGGEDVDEGEGEGAGFEAVEDAEAAGEGRED